jgi:predicted phage terminase large subunit-like protein
MAKEYKEVYGSQEAPVDVVLIEEKGSGISLAQDLDRAGIPVSKYNPGKAGKVQRLHAVSHLIEGGKVWIPESSTRKDDFADWAWPLIRQMMSFPNAARDDLTDTATQALALLRDYQFITTDEDAEIERKEREMERDKNKNESFNPYGV